MKNWIEYMIELEIPDERREDADTWILEEVVKEEMHNAWGIYDCIPSIFMENSDKDMIEEFGTEKVVLPGNIKAALRYGFNLCYENLDIPLEMSKVIPDVSPFDNMNLSADFCNKNLRRGVVTVRYNWDDYLFAYMLTETEMKNVHHKLYDYIDDIVEFRMECNEEHRRECCIIGDGKEQVPGAENNRLEISSGILEESERSIERAEERGIIKAELKVLYKRRRLKERLTYICEHLYLSSYYWKLDFLYLTKIFALEIIENNNSDSFENELNAFLSKVDSDDEVKSVGGGFDTEKCLNSWYNSLADIAINEDTDDVIMQGGPCWKMKLCLALLYNAKKLFLKKENEKRLDGYRYEDIEKLWEDIIRLCGKEDMELQKYYFEALTGRELCRIEAIYAKKILGAIDKNVAENRAEVKRLLEAIFNQFHEFPNICSRSVFVREIMEPFLVYSDDVDMVKSGLKHLCEIMPSMVKLMTEAMENVLQNILWRLQSCDEELIKQAERLNLLDIWEKQLSFFVYEESEELGRTEKDNHNNTINVGNEEKERKKRKEKERKLTLKDIYKEISVKYIRNQNI